MRQRVNASGISEAEISSQGGQNIVVELPGDPQEQREARELVRQSAQMRFRPVLRGAARRRPDPDRRADRRADRRGHRGARAADGATEAPAPTDAATDDESLAPAPTQTQDGRAVPSALRQAAAAPTEPAATEPAPTETAPAAEPAGPSDLAQITPEIQQAFVDLDCTDQANLTGGVEGEPDQPLVACSQDGAAKYVLGPVEVEGTQIDTATAGLRHQRPGRHHQRVGRPARPRRRGFDGVPRDEHAAVRAAAASEPVRDRARRARGLGSRRSSRRSRTGERADQRQLHPGERDHPGQPAGVRCAADLVRRADRGPDLGAARRASSCSGACWPAVIGLGLVVVYSADPVPRARPGDGGQPRDRRAAHLRPIALLSWQQGYRLSLPGVAGLIVAIGITADSFIVFFERVRDEVRDGRSLDAAVERAGTGPGARSWPPTR